jgi:hypothetical protein
MSVQAFDGIVTMTVDLGAELNAVAEGLARLVPPGGQVPSTATLTRSLHDVLRLHAAQVDPPRSPPALPAPPQTPPRLLPLAAFVFGLSGALRGFLGAWMSVSPRVCGGLGGCCACVADRRACAYACAERRGRRREERGQGKCVAARKVCPGTVALEWALLHVGGLGWHARCCTFAAASCGSLHLRGSLCRLHSDLVRSGVSLDPCD